MADDDIVEYAGVRYTQGLEPLDALSPEQHAARVLGIARWLPEPSMPWQAAKRVYFMRAASGAIKIGTAYNPKSRRRSIQAAMPEAVELLTDFEGGFEREGYLHGVFAAERIRGEWFAPSERLLALVARVARLKAEAEV